MYEYENAKTPFVKEMNTLVTQGSNGVIYLCINWELTDKLLKEIY